MISFSRCVTVIAVWTALGCVPAPAPARIPDPATPREPDRTPILPPSANRPSSFSYRAGTYTYELQQTTVVTVGTDSSLPDQDTLRTVAGIAYSISSVGAPTISAVIDSLVITSIRDTVTPLRRLTAPVTVSLPLIRNPIATAADSTALLSTCDSIEEAAQTLAADSYIQILVPIERGQNWTDSTSFTLCRGGIPLTATRISRFHVADVYESRDTLLARVTRQNTLSIVGAGMQGVRRITVRGQGTSETTFSYDLRAGRFLESTGESILQLGFETIQQTEQVVQRSRSTTRLRTAAPVP